MKVQNKRSYALEIPGVGVVDAGDVIEVSDELGQSLILQVDVWEEVDRGDRQSVPDVLAEVGDDPDKARTALAVENEHEKPRKSLVSRLEEIVSKAEEN